MSRSPRYAPPLGTIEFEISDARITAPTSKHPKQRLLGSVQIGGVSWKVFLVDPKLLEKYAAMSCEAFTWLDGSEIYVDASLEWSRQKVLIVHEVCHAIFGTPGYAHVLSRLFRCKHEHVDEIEEDITSWFAPHLSTALDALIPLLWSCNGQQQTTRRSTHRRPARKP